MTGRPGAFRLVAGRIGVGQVGPGGVGALVGLVVGLVALGPALRPGYTLWYDMVFVPRLALSGRTLGVDGSVPRAVPNDLVVSLASHIVPGWLVQKVILLGTFVLVGAGVGALSRSRLGAAAAALAATWNPWLAERLAIGHWGFTAGYAVLPWVLLAALAARRGERWGRVGLCFAVVAASLCGSTAAVCAALLFGLVLLVPRPRRSSWGTLAIAGGVWVLANASWWFPYLVLAPVERADAAGVAAFASRADTPFGVLGSVLTGGGIWNRGAWFVEREVFPVALLALTAVGAVLALALRERAELPWWAPAGGAGLVGSGIAVVSALPGGGRLVETIVVHVPGGGLLRDSQKFAALWMLFVVLCAGVAAERVRVAVRRRGADAAAALVLAAVVALWPIASLPSLAGGAWGRWAAVPYPTGFLAVADRIEASGGGDVAVFPWSLYRRYAWNGDRVVLDPWQRLVSSRVLVNDDLPLSDRLVRGESADAVAIREANAADTDLTPILKGLGVRWVILQVDQPSGGLPTPRISGHLVLQDDAVRVFDLGETTAKGASSSDVAQVTALGPWRYAGLGALLVALLGLVGYSWVVVGSGSSCARNDVST